MRFKKHQLFYIILIASIKLEFVATNGKDFQRFSEFFFPQYSRFSNKLVNFKNTVEHKHFCLNTKLNIMKIKCPLDSITRVVSKAFL